MAIEDKVNEILGIEQPKTPKEEFKAPVPRKEEKDKTDIDNDHKILLQSNRKRSRGN